VEVVIRGFLGERVSTNGRYLPVLFERQGARQRCLNDGVPASVV